MSALVNPRIYGSFIALFTFVKGPQINAHFLNLNQMTDSNKIIDFEQYESVMRQQKKVLTRMDEVLDSCTNITPEETSDWKEFWTNLKESSSKSSK